MQTAENNWARTNGCVKRVVGEGGWLNCEEIIDRGSS